MKAADIVVDELQEKQITVAKGQEDTYNAYQALVGILPWKPLLSRWKFSDEERKAIAEGADLFFTQATFGDPVQPITFTVADKFSEEDARELLNIREYEIRFIHYEDHSESTTVAEGEAKHAESVSYFPQVMINELMFTWEQLIDAPELADAKRYIERANGATLMREVPPAQPQQPQEAKPTTLEVGDGIQGSTKETIQ